uniref:4 kDa protein n=1 Tax=Grapevine leafroll-associated virus 3 TaxID=55951 RepID=A0A2R2Y3Z1_9CLOS|nr:4 kDa protein [Grapevine leafroll-associated virus 3]
MMALCCLSNHEHDRTSLAILFVCAIIVSVVIVCCCRQK